MGSLRLVSTFLWGEESVVKSSRVLPIVLCFLVLKSSFVGADYFNTETPLPNNCLTIYSSFTLLTLNIFADPTLNSYSKKKKYLTDTEIALRREETARKRKNLSEKKLEDEKVRGVLLPTPFPISVVVTHGVSISCQPRYHRLWASSRLFYRTLITTPFSRPKLSTVY